MMAPASRTANHRQPDAGEMGSEDAALSSIAGYHSVAGRREKQEAMFFALDSFLPLGYISSFVLRSALAQERA